MEKTKWDTLGKEKVNTPEPEQPQLKMLLIAGDNTGTGIQENLMDSGGVGLICETEADTVSTAIGGDHGHWSDLLRKCFDHDRLAYNRRTNHEYRECNVTFLCVLLSGTPAQIKPLIPSAETDCSRASCSTICLPLKNGKTSSTKRIQTMTPVFWNGGHNGKKC